MTDIGRSELTRSPAVRTGYTPALYERLQGNVDLSVLPQPDVLSTSQGPRERSRATTMGSMTIIITWLTRSTPSVSGERRITAGLDITPVTMEILSISPSTPAVEEELSSRGLERLAALLTSSQYRGVVTLCRLGVRAVSLQHPLPWRLSTGSVARG